MAGEYSLADMLGRIYENQLALEAAIMELTLWAEQQNTAELGGISAAHLRLLGKMRAISNKA